jgi:hypothetical protein
MRKLALALLVLFLGLGVVYAQQATLNTPVTRASEDNLRAETLYISRDNGGRWEVQVSVRDNGGNEIRRVVYSGPDSGHAGATALAIATAYTTARSGETGATARRLDFRLLGFLADQGYISGVTLVP